MAHCLPENSDEPATRENRAKLKRSSKYIHYIYRLFEESGTVDPLSPRKRLDCRRLDLRSELYVVGVILENPSMYLWELCVEIMHVLGIEISPKYCVQDTEKIWTHEEEDSPSCIAEIQRSIYGSVLFIEKRHVSVDNRYIRCTVLTATIDNTVLYYLLLRLSFARFHKWQVHHCSLVDNAPLQVF